MIDIVFDKDNNAAFAYDNNIKIGECVFVEKNNTWNIVHTGVDNSYRGQGIAKKLVECIINNAKENNKKLIAECSYAKKLLDRLNSN